MAASTTNDLLGWAAPDKRLEVLLAIQRTGSISEAARDQGISYKAAWQAVDTLSNLAGQALVDKAVGGRGGGGAQLTPAGLEVVRAGQWMQGVRQQAWAEWVQQGRTTAARPSAPGPALGAVAMGLRTSMRNQWPAEVAGLRAVPGGCEVRLVVSGGQSLVSRITQESRELLELRRGRPVLAMCKATSITVAPTIVALGQVNVLDLTVLRKAPTAGPGEVVGQVGEGVSLVGVCEQPRALKRHQAVQAAFAHQAVVLALWG